MKIVATLILICRILKVLSSPSVVSERIVGGTAASAGQFPFSAAIYVQTATASFFCGGALIDNQHVLTAAHCAEGATQFTIRLGSNSLSTTDPNRVTVATSTHFIHHGYNPANLQNNIAIIRLHMPIEFTSYIKPIELSTGEVTMYDHMTAIGWGQVNDSSPVLSDHLLYVSLITIKNEECMNVYGLQVTEDMVCAVGNYNEGTCIGDTGSPLIEHIYIPQSVRLAGISSFISGSGCEQPHPSGYTRVHTFIDWIQSVINAQL